MHYHRRTGLEVLAIGVSIAVATVMSFVALDRYFGTLIATAIVVPASVACYFAAAYGYYLGWVRHNIEKSEEAERRVRRFRRLFRASVLSSLSGVTVVLGAALLTINITAGVLISLLGVAVAPWAVKRIKAARQENHE